MRRPVASLLAQMSLLCLLIIPVEAHAAREALRHADTPARLVPGMAADMIADLAGPTLLAIGLLMA
jgi:hypothetical protein